MKPEAITAILAVAPGLVPAMRRAASVSTLGPAGADQKPPRTG
ncbi:MAG: hypothetical protein KatS3mg118_3541 [Paracoccaceae bacterium]|nr:MAG: hypothetical protein KatS3mg118_3541 [Paracoccaceae bacterium]